LRGSGNALPFSDVELRPDDLGKFEASRLLKEPETSLEDWLYTVRDAVGELAAQENLEMLEVLDFMAVAEYLALAIAYQEPEEITRLELQKHFHVGVNSPGVVPPPFWENEYPKGPFQSEYPEAADNGAKESEEGVGAPPEQGGAPAAVSSSGVQTSETGAHRLRPRGRLVNKLAKFITQLSIEKTKPSVVERSEKAETSRLVGCWITTVLGGEAKVESLDRVTVNPGSDG